MKNSAITLILLAGLLPAGAVFAQTRTSADYSITAETTDIGGGAAASAGYATTGSIGTIAGLSSVASPAETTKAGYIAQLYNLTALQITAVTGTVNVQQTVQLAADGLLDDGTILPLDAAAIAWGVQSGPITGISSSGLATAGLVYGDTGAVVDGSFEGLEASMGLTVINAPFDAWQVEYFGANNPLAAAGVDADGTGESNEFKYIAGLDPVDPTSRFITTVSPASSQPGGMDITFAPIVAGRTYAVLYSTDLNPDNWQPLTGASQSTSGNSMIVADPDASVPAKFYKVVISY